MSIESDILNRFATDVAVAVSAGSTVVDAVTAASAGIVTDADKLGTDLAQSATALVGVAIVSAAGLAITAEQAATAAATGAIDAATAVSSEAGARVRDAIISAVHGIEAIVTA
jgi:hypothetical protein